MPYLLRSQLPSTRKYAYVVLRLCVVLRHNLSAATAVLLLRSQQNYTVTDSPNSHKSSSTYKTNNPPRTTARSIMIPLF